MVFVLPSALPSHPPLHISTCVLPRSAFVLILRCAQHIPSSVAPTCPLLGPSLPYRDLFLSFKSDVPVSERDLACLLYLMTDLHHHHLALSPHPALFLHGTGHCELLAISSLPLNPLNVSLRGDSVSSRNCSRRGSSMAFNRNSLEIK